MIYSIPITFDSLQVTILSLKVESVIPLSFLSITSVNVSVYLPSTFQNGRKDTRLDVHVNRMSNAITTLSMRVQCKA